ncbi:MAG: hypothetical protein CBC09_01260 [Cellvibrionales bacterium TMED49]|nr:sarcosine oxidase, gamma subunit family protein [Porticoccaceae bacterium]OUU39908.1 MAG: hypothetical protein CBC09_01260 [Cellvibrionales bacterium TMED49]
MSNKYHFGSPIISEGAFLASSKEEKIDSSGISDARSLLTIREVVPAAQFIIRGDRGDESFGLSLDQNVKMAFPLEPCTYRYNSKSQLYWLGPDEWLLVSVSESILERTLRDRLKAPAVITDVSGGQTVLNLSGALSSIEAVLKKSSVYDFGAWVDADRGAGRCVRTTFAKASALIANRSDQSYDVIIRRSFADYVVRWLMDAGREFGSTFERYSQS